MDLTGAHALVTGASRGIGREIASVLASRGARLTLVARTSGALTSTASALGATALPADLAVPDEVRGLLRRAEDRGGPVDVLVNAAGLDAVGSSLTIDEDELARVFAVNLALRHEAWMGMIDT